MKTELQNFSWTLSNNVAGATNVTYTFEYTIVTANPYFIFYVLTYNNAMNTSSIGNPIALDEVRVEINGISAAIDNSFSYNYGNGLLIRLRDPTMANAGAHIKVELKRVSNLNKIGSFRWQWIRTCSHEIRSKAYHAYLRNSNKANYHSKEVWNIDLQAAQSHAVA